MSKSNSTMSLKMVNQMEANRRPGALCLARHREGARRLAALIALLVNRTVALNGHVQPCRDGVDGRNADAEEAAGHLVGGVVEFSTGVELVMMTSAAEMPNSGCSSTGMPRP